jgi:ribosomal protein S19E (S16A)
VDQTACQRVRAISAGKPLPAECAGIPTQVFQGSTHIVRKLDSTIEQIGFVAQEVKKIFPEAVTQAEDGYLDFNIHEINVALVNAVMELKAENDLLKNRLEKLEHLVGTMAEK